MSHDEGQAPMSRCEQTSETIVQIAARYAHHPDPNVRRMAMSLLTQYPGRNALLTPLGAHAYYNPSSRPNALAPYAGTMLDDDDHRGSILDDEPPSMAGFLQRG